MKASSGLKRLQGWLCASAAEVWLNNFRPLPKLREVPWSDDRSPAETPPASAPTANGMGRISPSRWDGVEQPAASAEKVDQVRDWIENYHKVKDHLEKISEINRELLRQQREQQRKRQRAKKA